MEYFSKAFDYIKSHVTGILIGVAGFMTVVFILPRVFKGRSKDVAHLVTGVTRRRGKR